MLFVLLLAAVVASAVISMRLCAGATAARVYGSLLGTLVLSGGITVGWFLYRFAHLDRLTVWRIMALVFHDACFTFPALFLGFYVLLIQPWRRRSHTRKWPAGAFPWIVSTAMVAVALGLAVVGIYAARIEPNAVEVTHTTIRTPDLRSGSKPLTIVQLSDLHIEKLGFRERRALKAVRSAKPDLILLTGDYTNYKESYPDVNRFLRQLHARYGVYAVHGNWNPLPAAGKLFEGTDIEILHYRSRVINTPSGRIVLAGVPWFVQHDARHALDGTDTGDSFVILLSHVPDTALYVPEDIDLVLSGHTHGGQVRFPWVGPVVTFCMIEKSRAAGLSRLPHGKGWLYVNRGLGMEGGGAPRIRFLCRPEVTVLHILPSQ